MFCFFLWWNCAFAEIQTDKKKKKQRQRSWLFAYVRVRGRQLEWDWRQCESQARRGSQPTSSLTSRPSDPPQHRHILWRCCGGSTLSSIYRLHHMHLYCSLEPSPLTWLKLYISHRGTVPATRTHQSFMCLILKSHTCKGQSQSWAAIISKSKWPTGPIYATSATWSITLNS